MLQGETVQFRDFRQLDGEIHADCRINGADSETILATLDKGDIIRIRIWVRERGGKATRRAEYVVSALWNTIDKMYVIKKNSSREYYLHKDSFLDALLTFRNIPLKVLPGETETSVRGDIFWKILTPPLNILSPMLPGIRSSIPWTNFEPGPVQ